MKRAPTGRRVVVVGGGRWGKNLIRNFHDLGALAAICERDPDTRAELRRQYSDCPTLTVYSDVLRHPGVDAVAIATPAESHADLVREALLSGLDVFVEKPLALTVAEGEALVTLARERGRVLMVGHLLWYHPAVLRLKDLVDGGDLGRIQYIYSNRLNLGQIRREENILWSFAPHDISVLLGLVGEMPETIQAQGGNYLRQSVADVTVSLLTFRSGVRAHVFVSWLHPFKEQKLIVVGDRAMAVFDDLEKTLVLYRHAIGWKDELPVPHRADGEVVPVPDGEPLRAECQHFLECVVTRRRPRTDGEEGLRVLRVLQRCQAALEGEAARVEGARRPAAYFAHHSAFIDDDVEIGEGTSIWHVSHVLKGSRIGRNCRIGQNVVIGPDVSIGDGVKIQNNVSVYEGVTLEDAVFCGPSVVFTNVVNPRSEIPRMDQLRPTRVRRGATLGANATILCGITIGSYAFVGAGAVATRDVPDHALVLGNPARVAGWMCACGVRLKSFAEHLECPGCGAVYGRDGGGLRALP